MNTIIDQFGGTTIGDESMAPTPAPVHAPFGEVDLLGFGDDVSVMSAPPPPSNGLLQSLSLNRMQQFPVRSIKANGVPCRTRKLSSFLRQ